MSENTATAVDLTELRALVANALELPEEEVTDEADFTDDLQVDSLMALEIVVTLEKRYRVKVSEADFKDVSTLAQVRALVEAKLSSAA